MDYIREMKFGGGMIWAIDLDDFTGVCGGRKNALLQIMNDRLEGYMVPVPDPSKLTTTEKPKQTWWPVWKPSSSKHTTTSTQTSVSSESSTTPSTISSTISSTMSSTTSSTTIKSTSIDSSFNSSTTDSTGSVSSTENPNICEQQSTLFVSHPYDCRKYYWCVHQRPIEQFCPTGTIWNNNSNRCDWSDSKTLELCKNNIK
jgi:hypothetical protein